MKKITALLPALLLCLLLCGCRAPDFLPIPEQIDMSQTSPSPAVESPAPDFREAKLEGKWKGHWEMFSAGGQWAEMDKFSWDCWAEISDKDSVYIWDEDLEKDEGVARLELSREESRGRVTGGWFMDNDSGFEHWRVTLKEDEQGLLLILRGSYSSEINGDFSFVFYLRPDK